MRMGAVLASLVLLLLCLVQPVAWAQAPAATGTNLAPAAAPAAHAAAATALTRPAMVPAGRLSGADTAWMMTATALVLLMTLPGVALFYAGMVRRKSVINTMASTVAIAVGSAAAFHSPTSADCRTSTAPAIAQIPARRR